jgi:transcriptional regulator with XRE-family HTH domain
LSIRQIIGDNVRCFRHKQEWSQEKLGLESGLHHDYIGRLERGTENISVDNLVKLADVLKVDPSVLLIRNYCFSNVA